MRDTNEIVLVGRLCKDMETKYSESGTCFGSFSIANNYSKKVNGQYVDEVNYIDILLIGKQAEGLKPYLKKGTQVCVSGEIRQDRWEKDGKRNSRTFVYASNVQLLGGKRDGAEGGNNYENEQTQFAYAQNDGGFSEDIPF